MNKSYIDVADDVSVIHNSRNVMTVYVENFRSGKEVNFLIRGDAHHDSQNCNRSLEKSHLEEIKNRNGFIIDVGDVFDAMQGKFDPRKSYDNLREEYKVANYLDKIVEDAALFYKPYAKNFLVIASGNHEASVLSNCGVDLTSNLVHDLNTEYGGAIQKGGYGGYVCIKFSGNKHYKRTIKYFHGAASQTSKSTIVKQATLYPDADIIVNGHTHESIIWPIKQERVTERNVVKTDIQYHVRTGTYEDSYQDGNDGWYVEGGRFPSPQGALFVRFFLKNDEIATEIIQDVK